MFWVIVYFSVAYLLLLPIFIAVSILLDRYCTKVLLRIITLSIILLLPFIPYALVTAQTILYRTELLPVVRASSDYWMGTPDQKYLKFRILKITSSRASVYVMEACGDEGNLKNATVIRFQRSAKGWKFIDWWVPWSDCGSAEGNVFPPYPEARSF